MTKLSDLLNRRLDALGPEWTKAAVAAKIAGLGDVDLRIHRGTIYKYFDGEHAAEPTETVLEALATVMPNVKIAELRRAAEVPEGEDEPWNPPAQSARMNFRQRRAVEELIKAFTDHGAHRSSTRSTRSTRLQSVAPSQEAQKVARKRKGSDPNQEVSDH